MTMYSPIFCYANYIKDTDITVSSNSASKTRLIDRNPERRWVAIAEGTGSTITLTVSDQIDTIAILNTNASTFTIKYNTSTDFSPALSQSVVTVGSGYSNYYFRVTAVQPSTNVKITITNTTDSKAVQIGQVIVTKQIHEIVAGGTNAVVPDVKQIMQDMSDGTQNKIYIRSVKGYDLTLNNATDSERALLASVYETNRRDAIFYIHRPAWGSDTFDGLCGHANWVNPFEFDDYYNNIKANGFTGKIELRQASGIQ